MKTKDYHFNPQTLLALLTHYTDGIVPMNGEVLKVLVHPDIQRKIALEVRSEEWTDMTPLFLGYDGKRTSSWSKGQEDVQWKEREGTPHHQ